MALAFFNRRAAAVLATVSMLALAAVPHQQAAHASAAASPWGTSLGYTLVTNTGMRVGQQMGTQAHWSGGPGYYPHGGMYFTVSWGDGTSAPRYNCVFFCSVGSFVENHTYNRSGYYIVTLSDSFGDPSYSQQVQVVR